MWQLSKKSLSYRAHPDSMSVWSASIRVGVFAILELGWIILAVVCWVKVIEIGDVEMLRINIKTVWTTFAILYQVIAVGSLAGVLLYTFSCEWNRRGIQGQSKEGNAVSTLTVGLIDQGLYAIFKHASLPFKLAFLASILATILHSVAPPTILIYPTPRTRNTNFMVGDFNSWGNLGDVAAAVGVLSNSFVFLEQIQNISEGYGMPNGTLFGMPSQDLLGQNLSWNSDVVYYDYTCSYRAPKYQSFNTWVVDQAAYIIDVSVLGGKPTLSDRTGFFGDIIGGPAGYDIAPLSGIWPLVRSDLGFDDDGTIAWLFIGTNNATYTDYSYTGFYNSPWLIEFLSLESIPAQNTTHSSNGFSDLWPRGTPNVTTFDGLVPVVQAVNASYSNTASVLQCNPHLYNKTRLIKMVNRTLTIVEDSSPDLFGSTGLMYNDAVGQVLATILNPLLGGSSQKYSARRTWDSKLGQTPLSPVNWIAGELTLQALGNTSLDSTVNGVAYYDVPLLPEEIASKIGKYVQSAAKAQLIHGLLPIPALNDSTGMWADGSQMQLSVTTMQTSLEQMFATIGLVVLILILAITLLNIGMGTTPLTVSTVETVLQGKDNYGGSGPIATDTSHESVPLTEFLAE